MLDEKPVAQPEDVDLVDRVALAGRLDAHERAGMAGARRQPGDDEVSLGDEVAARLTTSARHTGTFMGIEPTGNRYSIDEIHIFRLRDGLLVEHWHEFDKGKLMAQLKGEAPK